MKIESSTLSLSSTHAASVSRDHSETLRAWIGPVRPDFEGQRTAQAAGGSRAGVAVDFSARARQVARTVAAARAAAQQQIQDVQAKSAEDGQDAGDKVRIAVIEALLSKATGRRVRIHLARVSLEAPDSGAPPPAAQQSGDAAPAAPARAGWGLEYDAHDSVHETEQTTVAASGQIVTADGVHIQVSLTATLSRDYQSESDVSVRAGDGIRKDPLVIQFDGPASALGQGRFAFDLNADGQTENISTLPAGSGFLVLDANGDGQVNDGRELFGPATGSGFGELARYDQDGNGWIDAGDQVFGSLRVWRPNTDGSGALASLAELGVGAIGLARVATPFTFRDAANQTTGYAASTGLYLGEDGRAGTVQQIDLTA